MDILVLPWKEVCTIETSAALQVKRSPAWHALGTEQQYHSCSRRYVLSLRYASRLELISILVSA